MGTDEHVCPACGQPVATIVRRHKTLGAFVPVWGPGPCRNPKCDAYADRTAEPDEATARSARAVGRRAQGAHGPTGTQGVRPANAAAPEDAEQVEDLTDG
ncbi:hypothetical protein [Streptomyces heilongjiangensis]|uniref:Uncharacterized protein n=1 Tax=Streptomyces heilongjiangensis TaxID=945052 RepID=A0ABW1B038_9ACTN|nr:hypothetical protein [Streptomyces heilongjiangensis]MDC2945458.1 hypothetical protein [Streptomyces heilongjiangensis]